MPKEQLLQELSEAFEQLIREAHEADQRGVTRTRDSWGPREIVAHLTGWECIAAVHVPRVAAGMQPLFAYADETRQAVQDEALNTTMVTLVGEQSLQTLCGLLREAYQRDIEMLRKLDETFFQPGQYVYERTKGVVEHCGEHIEELLHRAALLYQERGRYGEAEPLFKRALAIPQRILGQDHPHTQTLRREYEGLLRELEGNPPGTRG